MEAVIINILTSFYTWIAVELIVIAILVFFVVKYSRIKKAAIKDMKKRDMAFRYKELDEMLVNKKRNER